MIGQISYWAFRKDAGRERSVVEAMRLAKEAGFAGIELAIGSEGDLTPDTSAAECRNLLAAAKAIGIKIGSIGCGLLWSLNPASADKKTRQQAIETVQKCLRVTADLGAKYLLVLPGHVDVFFNPDAEVVPYDVCYERSLVFAKAAGKAAKKYGVYACLENVWNKFLLSPLEFKAFIDQTRSPNVGSYFDIGNVWVYGYPQHWIKILGKAIKAVHVKDFKRAVGNVNGFCQLLEGDVPLAASLKLLKKQGYKGPVTAEVFPGPNDTDETEFLHQTAERLAQILP